MFIIRQAKLDDASALLKLAKTVHFINLPADLSIISAKIQRSRKAFTGKAENDREREFVFVLEDTETGNVIGTSSVIGCVSWPGKPSVFFTVRKRQHYSEDLQTGAVHVTLQLGTDESGPSEIGGLILSPSFRGHRDKLGSFLSLVRFHYIGLHRQWFADRIVAEMMAPLTPDSRNSLWEYLGRRFINLSYAEADLFCQHSKEFMTSLLPKDEIYVSMLPPEARNLIGKVGKETEPAKQMLENLGFQYKGQVDPFDGGPYLEADMGDIELITSTHRRNVIAVDEAEGSDERAFISVTGSSGYRAAKCVVRIDGDGLVLPPDVAEALEVVIGDEVGVSMMPSRSKAQVAEAIQSDT